MVESLEYISSFSSLDLFVNGDKVREFKSTIGLWEEQAVGVC